MTRHPRPPPVATLQHGLPIRRPVLLSIRHPIRFLPIVFPELLVTSLTAEDAKALYEMALRFDTERKRLSFPEHHGRLPNLIDLSQRLSSLSELLTEVSDEVLFRSTGSETAGSRLQAVGLFTAAAVHVRQAIRLVTEAHQQLSALHTADISPEAAAQGRIAAAVTDQLAEARLAVLTGGFLLHRAAEQHSALSPRVTAARSRSALPVPHHAARVPCPPPAQRPGPTTAAVPRRGR